MKHFPGDSAAEGDQESHTRDGEYNIFPGGQFFTHVLPFIARMDLPGKTKTVSAALTNYSIGIEADGSPVGGKRVGYSAYKINHLLREKYAWDGYILTDFGILTSKNYGVENLKPIEKRLVTLDAGCDAFGGDGGDGQKSVDLALEAYEPGVVNLGITAMDEIMKKSTERSRVCFVIRHKENLAFNTITERALPDNTAQHVLKDEEIELSTRQAKKKYPKKLRRVVVWDDENSQTIEIITNIFKRAAQTIATSTKPGGN